MQLSGWVTSSGSERQRWNPKIHTQYIQKHFRLCCEVICTYALMIKVLPCKQHQSESEGGREGGQKQKQWTFGTRWRWEPTKPVWERHSHTLGEIIIARISQCNTINMSSIKPSLSIANTLQTRRHVASAAALCLTDFGTMQTDHMEPNYSLFSLAVVS